MPAPTSVGLRDLVTPQRSPARLGDSCRELRVPLERPSACNHFIKNGTKAEDVGPCIQFLTFGLFGRHVGDSPDNHAFFCCWFHSARRVVATAVSRFC